MTNNDITIRDLIASFNIPAPILNTQTDRADIAPDFNRDALHALDDRLSTLYDALDPTMQRHLDYICDDFHADPFFHLASCDRIAALMTDPDLFPSINDMPDSMLDIIITDADLSDMMTNEFSDHTDDCDLCAD